jgi:hypothetical protein
MSRRRRAQRLAFCASLAALFSLSCITAQESRPQADTFKGTTMNQARKQAEHRRRRIIMNNDGNDCRKPKPDEPKTPENFLSKRTSPLAGSQVDAIFYCDGVFNSYTHRSEETERRGHGDQYAADWAWELGAQGRDALQIIADFGHKNGMEVFWSMRMNDTHDSGDGALLCQWKKDHPEYLMGKKGEKFAAGGGRWSAVNYGLPEVRDKVFRILKDVATRYDVDGIEMDFFRHPVYFKPQMLGEPVTQEHCDMMTDLLRRVRAMTEGVAARRGRPLLVAIRVPDSVEYCKAMGLDVERWLQEDLADILVVTCYFQLNPWHESVRLGHKYGVPVYPSLSESRVKGEAGKMRNALEAYRARAMNVWASGADGIYLFNYFNPRTALWRELGDAAGLEKLDKTYFVSYRDSRGAGSWLAGGKRFANLRELSPDAPIALKAGQRQEVSLQVSDDVLWGKDKGIVPELILRIQTKKLDHPEDLSIALNGKTLGSGAFSEGWLEFSLAPEAVVKGENRFEFLLKPEAKASPALLDILLHIRYPKRP